MTVPIYRYSSLIGAIFTDMPIPVPVRRLLISAAVFCLAAFMPLFGANAAPLDAQAVLSSPTQVTQGETFQVSLRIDARTNSIDTVRIFGSFDIQALRMVGYALDGAFSSQSPGSGIFPSSGSFSIGGYTVDGGHTGNIRFATLTFQAKKDGVASVNILSNSKAYSAGTAINIASTEQKIKVSALLVDKIVPPDEQGPSLSISSVTHPDQNVWYNKRDISIAWVVNGGSARENYLSMNATPISEPKEAVTGQEMTLKADGDGIWYVHVLSVVESGEKLQGHYRVMVDTSAPEPLLPVLEQDLVSTNVPNAIRLGAIDQLSGLERYEIRIDDQLYTVTSTPFILPALEPGLHEITVTAVDRAGNSTTRSTTLTILPTEDGISIKKKIDLIPAWSIVLLIALWLLYFIIRPRTVKRGPQQLSVVRRQGAKRRKGHK